MFIFFLYRIQITDTTERTASLAFAFSVVSDGLLSQATSQAAHPPPIHDRSSIRDLDILAKPKVKIEDD